MSQAEAPRPSLLERVPAGGTRDPNEILDRFLGWVADVGLSPYDAQEEAFLELMQDHHVILATPTGSGKSLVAEALHFKALCEGERSFYTAPIKALVSEKFFALCADFGPENVGMLTGDASINPDAPIICCTTEVLANMALRQGAGDQGAEDQGAETSAPYVVLDEFHYYADRERGVSWQIPLIALPDTLFLLMSATLGNTAPIAERLQAQSGREVAEIHTGERPVPLDFEYREATLHETIEDLLAKGKAPVYVVNFTQRDAAERAQGLTSANVATREQRQEVAKAVAGVRFDTPYGKDVARFVRHGIGLHHAGLLPKYRLLVEQLAQRGLLRVISGTDTLGVGVNVPIRTVVFSQLCKFDGEKVAILSVREFQQIAGRAGRKGFDEEGSVVVLAPEHVIENKRLAAKSAASGSKKRVVKKRAPGRGFVPWNRDTFQKLVSSPPEMLVSRFEVSHGMLVDVLKRPSGRGYRDLAELIRSSHDSAARKRRHFRHAAQIFRSLRAAEVVEVVRGTDGPCARVREGLQLDFSLHHTLSLYLVEALAALDAEAPAYALEVLSLAESILENPFPILYAQVSRAKGELVAELKAAGVPYEERMRKLEEVTWPRPEEDFIRGTFELFASQHPWVAGENIRPKSIAREMFEGALGFRAYVRDLGVARVEGVLLRYLSQAHNALVKSVPASARTDEVLDAIAYLRTELAGIDSSLVDAWESLVSGESEEEPREQARAKPAFDLAREPKALVARVRAELAGLVRALAAGDYEEAACAVRQDPDDSWDVARFEEALAPFLAEYERVLFTPDARRADRTRLVETGARTWDVWQVLVDPLGDDLWAVEGEIDLTAQREPEGPLVRVRRIGT